MSEYMKEVLTDDDKNEKFKQIHAIPYWKRVLSDYTKAKKWGWKIRLCKRFEWECEAAYF